MRTIKRHTGRGSLAATGLAKVISGNIKDNLTIAVGRNARYDFETHTMYLPGIPGDDLEPDVLREFRAFLQHESFERGMSTWTSDERFLKNATKGLHLLINGLNDVRINREGGLEYPGAMLNLKFLYNNLWEDLLVRNQETPIKPSVGAIAVMLSYIGEGTASYDTVVRTFPQLASYMKVIEKWARDIDNTTATEDACIDNALEIYKALKNPQENKPEPEPTPETSECDAGEDQTEKKDEQSPEDTPEEEESDNFDTNIPTGEPDDDVMGDEALGEDENPSESVPDPTGEATDEDGGEAPSEEGEDEQGASGDVGGPVPLGSGNDVDVSDGMEDDWPDEPLADEEETDPDMDAEALERLVEQMFGGQEFDGKDPEEDWWSFRTRNKARSYTYDDSNDHIYNPSTRTNDEVLDDKHYRKEAQALTIRLRRALTIQTPRTVRRQTRGYVDEQAVHRVVMGDEDIFKRPLKQEGDDIAGAVSWDESWSMSSKMSQVKMLAHAWNEAFNNLKFPLAMFGWTNEHGEQYRVRNRTVYRQDAMKHRIYKDFNEDPHHKQVLQRLNKITASGNTPMGEGLSFAVERLGQRRERRRVLFFMTDGQPMMSCNGDVEVHQNYILTTLERAERAGIEVIGLGIGVDLSHIFPQWVRVDSVRDLRGLASDQLVNVLRNGKRTATNRRRR